MRKMEYASGQSVQGDVSEIKGEQQSAEHMTKENPPRTRIKPVHLQDYKTGDTVDKLVSCADSCYRAVCGIPKNYRGAIRSTKSRQWIDAMNDEIQPLEENDPVTTRQKGSGG